ncbi:glutathione peroxidase [Chitinibacter sp. FCG-7]|uniref:Glutathione peroxidase n=1 Tax=Chitinibacter mangrovi TaxID=3153927 RepID=A0AAU7FAC3_9NEIS
MTTPLEQIALQTITAQTTTLASFPAKAKLIVNVASRCGLTPQYTGLEALYRQHQAAGLLVLGFPANNFKQQEPGTDEEIAAFCSSEYGVSFPLFSKISVTGADIHPLYQTLTRAHPERIGGESFRSRLAERGITPEHLTDILWNFEKFLLDEHNQIVARFAPNIAADDPALLDELAKLLS